MTTHDNSTPATGEVTEEMVEQAQRIYLDAAGSGADAMRKVLKTFAPLIAQRERARGMRRALAIIGCASTEIDFEAAALSPKD